MYDEVEHAVVKNEVRLQQQRILLEHILLGQGQGVYVVGLVVDVVVYVLYLDTVVISVADMGNEFFLLVSYYDDHT